MSVISPTPYGGGEYGMIESEHRFGGRMNAVDAAIDNVRDLALQALGEHLPALRHDPLRRWHLLVSEGPRTGCITHELCLDHRSESWHWSGDGAFVPRR